MLASANKPACLMSKVSDAKYENSWIIKNMGVAINSETYQQQLKHEIEVGVGSSMHSKWVLSLERRHSGWNIFYLRCNLRKIIYNDISEFLQCRLSADCENNDGKTMSNKETKNNMKENDSFVIEFILANIGGRNSWQEFCGETEEVKISFQLSVFSTPDPGIFKLEEEFRTQSVAAAEKNLTSALFDGSEACDVKLICGDGKELMCHREMLKASSPVFKAMMESGLSEAQTGQIHIADISGEIMEMLLQYMYTGKLKETWRGPKAVSEFTYAAVKYEMTALIDYLDSILGTIFQPDWDSSTLTALANLTRKLSLKKAETKLKERIVQQTLSDDNLSDVLSGFKFEKCT